MKAYVAIPYTDGQGKHEVNEEVEFDLRNADTDTKEGVERLLDYGIISRTPVETQDSDTGQKQG